MTRRKRYSKEFKREALRRANENGVTDTLVAEDAFPGQGNAHDKEVMLLKRENAKRYLVVLCLVARFDR